MLVLDADLISRGRLSHKNAHRYEKFIACTGSKVYDIGENCLDVCLCVCVWGGGGVRLRMRVLLFRLVFICQCFVCAHEL